jgi:hypothetical protein
MQSLIPALPLGAVSPHVGHLTSLSLSTLDKPHEKVNKA